MSAAKMVADSTQGDSIADSKKRKKKVKKSVAVSKKKVVLPEDEDSDLDLKKDLHPIGFYLKDRLTMIENMFHSVRGASLQRALPELLKSMPLEELKSLCLEQLEVMSKKRIQRILDGEESANISSSGTDDMDDYEEDADSSDEDLAVGDNRSNSVGGGDQSDVIRDNVNTIDDTTRKNESCGLDEERAGGLVADSTSAIVNSNNNNSSEQYQPTNSLNQQDNDNNMSIGGGVGGDKNDKLDSQQQLPPLPPFPPPHPIEEVVVKQEPPDSEPEEGHERNYRRRRQSSSRSRSRSHSRSSSRSSRSSHSSKASQRRKSKRSRRRRRRGRSRRSRSSGSSSSSRSRSRSRKGKSSSSSSESDKASLIEGSYEEPPEEFTSGSEDGELVRKETVVRPAVVTVKQEVMSEPEDGASASACVDSSCSDVAVPQATQKMAEGDVEKSAENNVNDGVDCGGDQSVSEKEIGGDDSDMLDSSSVTKSSLIEDGGDSSECRNKEDNLANVNRDDDDNDKDNDDEDDGSEDDDDDDDDEEEEERSTDGTAGGGGDGGEVVSGSSGGDAGEKSVLPSIMMDQMELLELEMRARAIKAMLLTSSSQTDEGSEKK